MAFKTIASAAFLIVSIAANAQKCTRIWVVTGRPYSAMVDRTNDKSSVHEEHLHLRERNSSGVERITTLNSTDPGSTEIGATILEPTEQKTILIDYVHHKATIVVPDNPTCTEAVPAKYAEGYALYVEKDHWVYLGDKEIEGIKVHGYASSNHVFEDWYAPDLQMNILSVSKIGGATQITRYRQIQAKEPDPTRFSIPAGFVVETKKYSQMPAGVAGMNSAH